MSKWRLVLFSFPFLLVLAAPSGLSAENGVRPGRFTVEPPTLLCLGFDWEISGDENRNASVDVIYRKLGEAEWRPALPLLRLGGERIFRDREYLSYTVPDAFAGSILELQPETEYEVRLTMSDPDGVTGEKVQTAKVRTRGEPRPATGGRTIHVYPPEWKGPVLEPFATGLKEAYYGPGRGDWSVVSERKVQAGDVILIHAGLYKADRLDYVNPLSLPFDGTYVFSAKGTAEKPITIKAAGDGEVIFDGNGCARLFDVIGTEHNIFEGLTIRNTDLVFHAGLKGVMGAKALTVRKCRMEDIGVGVRTEFAGSRDFYIADNVMIGRDDRYRLLGWSNPGIYGANQLKSFYGVKVYGSGHVVCHNAVAYFHDGITVSTYGTPEPEKELQAVAIDFYNNDIHVMADDFIETDGGVHNIRVFRNRGVNAFHSGLSAQPMFGGPVYFVRNVLYHVAGGRALKLSAKPAGLLVYHNTFITENGNTEPYGNAHFRNNLFLGNDTPGRGISAFPNATAYSTFDYNGYRPNRAGGKQYQWSAPAPGRLRDYELGNLDFKSYQTLAALRDATGSETHGTEVDYDLFERMQPPAAGQPHAVYHAADLSFKIKPASKAVDTGLPLPTVNDKFRGRAPDLGALEAGDDEPVYGPRGQKPGSFYR